MEKEEMADSSVSEAVGKLMDVSIEESGQFVGATDELEKLKDTYLSIQRIIYDAKERQVFDYRLQSWLSELEKEAEDLYELLEEYYLISDASSGPIETKKLYRCFPCFPSDFMEDSSLRRKMEVQIKKIMERLDENVDEKERFTLENVDDEERFTSECRYDTQSAVDVFRCLSFFSIFIPTSNAFSLFSIRKQSSEPEDSTPLLPSELSSENVYVKNSCSSEHTYDATSFRDESETIITIPGESVDSTQAPLPSRFLSENVYEKNSFSSEYRYDSPAENATSFRDESIIIVKQAKEAVILGESEDSKQLLLVRLRKEFDEIDKLLQDRLMAAASSGRNKNKKKACECLYSIVDYVQTIIPRYNEKEVRSENIRERFDRLAKEVRAAAAAGGGQNRSSNQIFV